MSVSVNNSYTADMRTALSSSLAEALRSGIAMATGNSIIHAYEDPTGLAIGSSMKADLDVLKVVATGIEQSQAMLYMAEGGIKSAHETVTQMNQILARAKLGYMTDELVKDTLSQTYNQLKSEIDRIANSVDFNGQKLLNGTGGKVTAAKAANVNTVSPQYDFTASTSLLKDITIPAGLSAVVNGTGAAVAISLNGGKAITSGISVSTDGAEFAVDTVGKKTTITGATIRISDVSVSDATNNTCVGEVVLKNVTLTVAGTPGANGTISGTVTMNQVAASDVSISVTHPGKITGISGNTGNITPTSTNIQTQDITTTYSSTGGILGTSTFKFVTGIELNKDVIRVSFPDLNLRNIIPSLDVDELTGSTQTSLSSLISVKDAETDIPIMAALEKALIVCLDDIGAYQKRFLNLQSQLRSSIEQLDNAQGAIMNADLAVESEIYARATVKVNIAIARLNTQNQMLQNLQRIVTG